MELETAIAPSGQVVAYGTFVDPREQGVYEFAAEGAEILVQDRWDIMRSVEGTDRVEAPWREAAEIFVRYAPGDAPDLSATLRDSYRSELVNLLRNGSFEEGSPGYPPRAWTTWHPRKMGLTWPWWTQEDATEGESCLKFVRPEIPMTLHAQPIRLRTGGTYVLRFMARGNATEAKVVVSGQRRTGATVEIEPSGDWRRYEAEMELVPGYTRLSVIFAGGGEPDQVLWMDDVQIGRVSGN
jgi:hypothetical protein